MAIAAHIVVLIVALLHVYFLVLEMFLWDKPAGRKAFGLTLEQAQSTKVLAANQGLYNGFLAAGLLWGLGLALGQGADLAASAEATHIQLFFLGCVLVAGVYGAATASKKILYVQALPAAIGIALVWLA